MPERKGRKRRARGRSRGARADAGVESSPSPKATPNTRPSAADSGGDDLPLPSLRVRYAGFVLALITIFVGILTLLDGLAGGSTGIDQLLRIVGGGGLIVLALAIGALSLAPGRVRALLSRGKAGLPEPRAIHTRPNVILSEAKDLLALIAGLAY